MFLLMEIVKDDGCIDIFVTEGLLDGAGAAVRNFNPKVL